MDLKEFLSRLHVDRGPNVNGEYMCRCPAHDDKTASLCVREGQRGIVLKCQAGCVTNAVVAAMGLSMSDLFRDPSKPRRAEPKDRTAAKPAGSAKGAWAVSYTHLTLPTNSLV